MACSTALEGQTTYLLQYYATSGFMQAPLISTVGTVQGIILCKCNLP